MIVTSKERISISEDGVRESYSRKALLTVLADGRVRLAVGLDDRSYAIVLDRDAVTQLASWLNDVAAKDPQS